MEDKHDRAEALKVDVKRVGSSAGSPRSKKTEESEVKMESGVKSKSSAGYGSEVCHVWQCHFSASTPDLHNLAYWLVFFMCTFPRAIFGVDTRMKLHLYAVSGESDLHLFSMAAVPAFPGKAQACHDYRGHVRVLRNSPVWLLQSA